jgi:glycolate oxidase
VLAYGHGYIHIICMISGSIIRELRGIVGKEHLHTSDEEVALYSYDATPFAPRARPDAVVFPGSAEEVASVVQLANRARFAVVPRGAGSGLTGGARPILGGVVLSTQRLNRIVKIDSDNLQVVVQPGVVTEDLQNAVEEVGLFYPPDPQSKEFCTIGGNLAENAGGPRAMKYGVTRNYVLALQAVLPEGTLVRLGARTVKSVVGYDLLSLLVGCEGTLGIITEATLRLLPDPEARGTLLAVFDDMRVAAAAVSATFKAGVMPSAIEFMDRASIRCVEEYEPAGLPTDAAAVLVVEVDGGSAEVERLTGKVKAVMEANGARQIQTSANAEEAEALWKSRRAVGPALARIAPIKVNEDIVVPLSRLPEAVSRIHELARKHEVECACFGHAGDGNIHVNLLVDTNDEQAIRRADQAVDSIFELVIQLEGSITGEHGVGTTKQHFIGMELKPEVIDTMVRVKRALDPRGILNPGKIFPWNPESNKS